MCKNESCEKINCDIEYGECHCGCQDKTNLVERNCTTLFKKRGEPYLYIRGHQNRNTNPDYIIDKETGCWNWQKSKNPGGYGNLWVDGKCKKAHRVYYEKYKGFIPEGLDLDHLCHNRGCVNPDHLEAVNRDINCQRGDGAKLTLEQVREIRDKYSLGEYSYAKLANIYEVKVLNIYRIIKNKIWKE